MNKSRVLAFDFGASSGRAILGEFDGSKLTTREIHRFSNDPVEILGNFHWDVLRLFWDIKQGLLKYEHQNSGQLSSIGIDTWGVDFGLLDSKGRLLGNPYHYRDDRTDGMMEEAFKRMDKKEIFKKTGIAFQKFNTLYQILSMRLDDSPILNNASTLLFMPDLFAYLLTGEKSTEFTEATTSQMLEAGTKTWSNDLLSTMNIPTDIFTDIVEPGTIKGMIVKSIADELNIGQLPVINVASHDTGSAVAAVPALDEDYAFLSSGTWSLMGVEVRKPIINEKTFRWNYTNEGCVGGTYRPLRNIMGLWIIQECKREWDRQGEVYDFGTLVDMAEKSQPFMAFIDPDNELFYSPGNMPSKIQNYCNKTDQHIPQTKGEIIRCVIESLALKYRWSFERLEEIIGKELKTLHIVGGGTQNRLLNQFTANAINKPVICGPIEATAIGNLMVQFMALGEVKDMHEIRQVIRDSFPTEDYFPQNTDVWNEAYDKFQRLI